MKKLFFPLPTVLVLLLTFLTMECSKIEIEAPAGGSDTSQPALPVLRVLLDSTGKGTVPIDSLIKKYPSFSIRFFPISVGTFSVDYQKGWVVFERSRNNWTRDSCRYEVCFGSGKCLQSTIYVFNPEIPDTPDGCDTLPTLGPIQVPLLGQTLVTVWPRASSGKITSLRTGYYSANVVATDSNVIRFRATMTGLNYGFDEIWYTVTDSLGQCHTGLIVFSVGDPCETAAVDDEVAMTGNLGRWPVETFLANDAGCEGPGSGLLFRVVPEIIYGPYLSIPGPNGIRTDTTINGFQYFQYRRTNPSAVGDEFWYYIHDPASNRVTRARLKIHFQ